MTLYINQVHFYLWIRIRTIHLYSYLRKFEFVLVSDKNIDIALSGSTCQQGCCRVAMLDTSVSGSAPMPEARSNGSAAV